jgi:hypothetical protein
VEFLHDREHSKDTLKIREHLSPLDPFQSFEVPDQSKACAGARSYSHLVEYDQFYFLIGEKVQKDGDKQRVIGTYVWNGERFFALYYTPHFHEVSGPALRKALFTFNLDTISPSTSEGDSGKK